jgi:hypothetical protein
VSERGTMPTLINELNPMQLEWLYENQMTDGELKEGTVSVSSYLQSAASVFRNVQHNNLSKHKCRKRKRDDSTTSTSSMDGVVFPFEGELLAWSEQFENLMAYKRQHGVSTTTTTTMQPPQYRQYSNNEDEGEQALQYLELSHSVEAALLCPLLSPSSSLSLLAFLLTLVSIVTELHGTPRLSCQPHSLTMGPTTTTKAQQPWTIRRPH